MKFKTVFKISVVLATMFALKKYIDSQREPALEKYENDGRHHDIVEEAMLESFPASDPTAYR